MNLIWQTRKDSERCRGQDRGRGRDRDQGRDRGQDQDRGRDQDLLPELDTNLLTPTIVEPLTRKPKP